MDTTGAAAPGGLAFCPSAAEGEGFGAWCCDLSFWPLAGAGAAGYADSVDVAGLLRLVAGPIKAAQMKRQSTLVAARALPRPSRIVYSSNL